MYPLLYRIDVLTLTSWWAESNPAWDYKIFECRTVTPLRKALAVPSDGRVYDSRL